MQDDELNKGKALNETDQGGYLGIPDPVTQQESPVVEETSQTEEPTETSEEESEEVVEETVSDEDAGEEATETEEVESQGEKKDRSAKARISELTRERDEERQARQKLEEQMRAGRDDLEEFELPPLPELKPGEEVTPEQYQKHVAQTASALVTLQLKQRDNVNRIKGEIAEVLAENPELSPKAENYDPDLSESISTAVESFIKTNPTGSVKAYVDKLLKPYKRSVEKAVGKQTETVAKQVSKTALRPTQVKPTAKKFEELSLEEMEAKLGKVF